MTNFNEYLEQQQTLPTEARLGALCWYSIETSVHVDHAQFCRTLLEAQFETTLPSAPRPHDVFKRSCTANQRKRVPTADPNVFANFLIRDVGTDNENVWRMLVEEQVDNEGHTLEYQELCELRFWRPGATIRAQWKVGVPSPEARGIVINVKNMYHQLENMLPSMQIREFVRKFLMGCNATVVRPSGGVYFVREAHAAKMSTLETVINDIPGCSMHSLPLVDDPKQRAMLKRAFEDESIGEIDNLLGEMSEILRGDSRITSDRYADFKVKHDFLMRKVTDYSDLLDVAMQETASRLEIMRDVMFELLSKVRVSG